MNPIKNPILAGIFALTTSATFAQAPIFQAVVIRHSVADFDKWKPGFDADSTGQKAAGMTNIVVSRGIENPNDVESVFMLADVPKAKTFVNDPRLKDVMQRAGVTSAPHITFLNVVRANAAGQNVTDYVEIIHKVADFDKWLKVYDAEGSATRAAEGMVDGILARSIDDPSMVYLVFDITDPAKAKAALASEAKKKLMMGAGVISKPEILFFRSVVAH